MQVAIHDVSDPSLHYPGNGTNEIIRLPVLREAMNRLLARLALSPEKIKAETTLSKG